MITRATNVLIKTYPGKMAVYEYVKTKFGNTASLKKQLTFDNIPCFLTSMVTNRSTARDSSGSSVNKVSVAKKVFLPAEYIVPAGCFIEIYQDNRFYEFDYSGESFVYCTHQEIILENEEIT